jgi:hypothetical protein
MTVGDTGVEAPPTITDGLDGRGLIRPVEFKM